MSTMIVRDGGMPTNSIIHAPLLTDVGNNFVPAPLDNVSFVNGVLKYDTSQFGISSFEYYEIGSWLDQLYGPILADLPMWTKLQALNSLDPTKANGPPYCWLYGTKKGDTLRVLRETLGDDEMVFEHLYDHFRCYVQVCNGTLKVELRAKGKDARFFIPDNIAMVAVGAFLFGAQNDAIATEHQNMPIKIGMNAPGGDAYNFWSFMEAAAGMIHQFDGQRNDAVMALIMLMVVRDFRKRYLPHELHKEIDRYYDMSHSMWVNVRGALLPLDGQKSGQINTAMDNSLVTLSLLMLHAIRNDISYCDFIKMPLGIVGDDILLKDNIGCFDPVSLDKTWESVGMYLECPSLVEQFHDVKFMGMSPKKRTVFGREFQLYTYDEVRLTESFNYIRKNFTSGVRLMKLVAITSLTFANEPLYEKLKRKCFEFAHNNRETLTAGDWTVLGQLTDLYQLMVYCGFEPTYKKGF